VACKWGIDEDIVRAQVATESTWRQPVMGDWSTRADHCAPGHGIGVDELWLNHAPHGPKYAAGDTWGCIGRWYAGQWHTPAAQMYIGIVQCKLANRVWALRGF